jgi:DNA polymerase-3 subunit alpha
LIDVRKENMLVNIHTNFSYNYGMLSPKQLVEELAIRGYKVAALTDVNNTSAIWDYVDYCKSAGIRPVAGIDFKNLETSAESLYIVLARNNVAFQKLNEMLSAFLHSETTFPERCPTIPDTVVIYPFRRELIGKLQDHEYMGIRPHDIKKLFAVNRSWLERHAVALLPISFLGKNDFYLHCLMRAMAYNTLLSKLQRNQAGDREESLLTQDEVKEVYKDYPFLIRNAESILDKCSITFDYDSHKNKKCFTASVAEDKELLTRLSYAGLERRYGADNADAKARLEKELEVIERLDFMSYFLTTWDIVRYSKERGFFYVGRGSGANSIAAYCLQITDVDPIELNLYFERFLNMYRSSPPDFDMDFSWKDRDEIFAYLFKKYGKQHVAMLGSHSTFKFRATVRELSKVYGLPAAETDRLIREIEFERLVGVRHSKNRLDTIKSKIIYFGKQLDKFPNYLSVHSSGVVISEQPIHYFSATQVPPKGFPITQFDMYTADKIKLHKLDVLSQRGLGHIKDCVEIIKENRGVEIDITRFQDFKKDMVINNMLRFGDTIGCFYIESPAMRLLMRKLKCDNYLTLVAASSIIRPGVSNSGMAKEYIVRHHNPNGYTPIHPKLNEILGETYGVMVYQEDVIKVAHHFAGFSLADADMLRRAMAWKFRVDNGFEQMEEKYFTNCKELGYPEDVAREVWRQMESFAGYSFCKAHSASYAVESYQSLFLKAYYPLEFMVAVINNFGGYYDTQFYVNEARRSGANINAPCVNTSEYLTRIIGKDIYLGFIHLKGLEKDFADTFQSERTERGAFVSLENFCVRLRPAMEQIFILINIGAFRFTGKTKIALRWEAALLISGQAKEKNYQKERLFPVPAKNFHIPQLQQSFRTDAKEELQLLGFPLVSWFDLVEGGRKAEIKARDMVNNIGKKVLMVGYVFTLRTAGTSKGDTLQFVNFVDDEGYPFDAVLFPQIFKRFPILQKGVYAVTGKVVDEYGVQTLEVQKWEMLEISLEDNTALVKKH